MPRVLKTPAAEEDLFEIGTYIAKDDPSAADRLLVQFDEKLKLLANAPFIGVSRDVFAPGLRSLPIGKYLIFYQPTNQRRNRSDPRIARGAEPPADFSSGWLVGRSSAHQPTVMP